MKTIEVSGWVNRVNVARGTFQVNARSNDHYNLKATVSIEIPERVKMLSESDVRDVITKVLDARQSSKELIVETLFK